jgi:hypothetical protein
VVRTGFGAEDQAAHLAIMIRAARPFMKTPAQGAVTPGAIIFPLPRSDGPVRHSGRDGNFDAGRESPGGTGLDASA